MPVFILEGGVKIPVDEYGKAEEEPADAPAPAPAPAPKKTAARKR
jgi:hypothetical protein